jgi:hypothetical protein
MTSTNNVKRLSRIRHYHWASLLDIEDAVVSGLPISLRTGREPDVDGQGTQILLEHRGL